MLPTSSLEIGLCFISAASYIVGDESTLNTFGHTKPSCGFTAESAAVDDDQRREEEEDSQEGRKLWHRLIESIVCFFNVPNEEIILREEICCKSVAVDGKEGRVGRGSKEAQRSALNRHLEVRKAREDAAIMQSSTAARPGSRERNLHSDDEEGASEKKKHMSVSSATVGIGESPSKKANATTPSIAAAYFPHLFFASAPCVAGRDSVAHTLSQMMPATMMKCTQHQQNDVTDALRKNIITGEDECDDTSTLRSFVLRGRLRDVSCAKTVFTSSLLQLNKTRLVSFAGGSTIRRENTKRSDAQLNLDSSRLTIGVTAFSKIVNAIYELQKRILDLLLLKKVFRNSALAVDCFSYFPRSPIQTDSARHNDSENRDRGESIPSAKPSSIFTQTCWAAGGWNESLPSQQQLKSHQEHHRDLVKIMMKHLYHHQQQKNKTRSGNATDQNSTGVHKTTHSNVGVCADHCELFNILTDKYQYVHATPLKATANLPTSFCPNPDGTRRNYVDGERRSLDPTHTTHGVYSCITANSAISVLHHAIISSNHLLCDLFLTGGYVDSDLDLKDMLSSPITITYDLEAFSDVNEDKRIVLDVPHEAETPPTNSKNSRRKCPLLSVRKGPSLLHIDNDSVLPLQDPKVGNKALSEASFSIASSVSKGEASINKQEKSSITINSGSTLSTCCDRVSSSKIERIHEMSHQANRAETTTSSSEETIITGSSLSAAETATCSAVSREVGPNDNDEQARKNQNYSKLDGLCDQEPNDRRQKRCLASVDYPTCAALATAVLTRRKRALEQFKERPESVQMTKQQENAPRPLSSRSKATIDECELVLELHESNAKKILNLITQLEKQLSHQ